jgi:hypothetical protein
MSPVSSPSLSTGIDLYWLPLGAGGHSVRLNGRIFEALAERLERRDRYDLYHSSLEVRVLKARFAIEMTPIRSGDSTGRRRRSMLADASLSDFLSSDPQKGVFVISTEWIKLMPRSRLNRPD